MSNDNSSCCTTCQEPVSEGWDECPACGNELFKKEEFFCPKCSEPTKVHWQKCPICKTPLSEDSSSQESSNNKPLFQPRLYDQPIHDLAYPDEPVGPLCFSPCGKFLATAHKASAHLWSTENGLHFAYIGKSHSSQINDICFDSHGRWVFSAADGETIVGHDMTLDKVKYLCLFTEIGTHPKSITFVEEGKPLLVAATRQALYFYDDIESRFSDSESEEASEPSLVFKEFGSHKGFVGFFWSEGKKLIVAVTEGGKIFHLSVNPTSLVSSKKLDVDYVHISEFLDDRLWLCCNKKINGKDSFAVVIAPVIKQLNQAA